MKVYISGKIGEEHPSPETLARFKVAEDMLLKKGYEVFNPTTSGFGVMADEAVLQAKDEGLETTWYAEIMKLDLDALSFCDAVYMMGDFFGSEGATAEYYFAIALGKPVFFQDKHYARNHSDQQLMKRIRRGELELSPNCSFLQASHAYFEKNKDRVWLPL